MNNTIRRTLSQRLIGNYYEKQAEHYLKQQGFSLVKRNFYCRFGEIDLIMQNLHSLLFVEVRYRKQQDYGSACESVNFNKQQKIIKTAHYFLNQFGQYQHFDCRFDVIGISQQGQQIEWIKNAFTE